MRSLVAGADQDPAPGDVDELAAEGAEAASGGAEGATDGQESPQPELTDTDGELPESGGENAEVEPAANANGDGAAGGDADATPAEPAEPEMTEAERILGPDVKSPVGIPRAYMPSETSTHELLHVDLGEFVGPLDLLLFLIRKHDFDIFDIPIAYVTEQYVAMIDRMDALEIDVAAEFLVMAAELTHIKSKMLLPPKEGVPVDPDEEDDGDPRSDLVRRLLEYQKYRDAAEQLGDRDRLGKDIFARDPGDPQRDESFDPGFRAGNVFKLVEAMADVLARLEPESQHEVTPDRVTVSERVRHILKIGQRHGKRFTFVQIFREGDVTRRSVVMTFLALLEMARTRVLRITQEPERIEAPPPMVDDDDDETGSEAPTAAAEFSDAPASEGASAAAVESSGDDASASDGESSDAVTSDSVDGATAAAESSDAPASEDVAAEAPASDDASASDASDALASDGEAAPASVGDGADAAASDAPASTGSTSVTEASADEEPGLATAAEGAAEGDAAEASRAPVASADDAPILVRREVEVAPLTPPEPGEIVLELTDAPVPADLVGEA